MAGEKIIKVIHQMAKETTRGATMTDLIYGEVISINPLEIKIDSRYIINEEFIILSSLCIEKKLNGQLLWRGLQVGDIVRILRVHNGQLFYVLEREGGLTT